MNRPRPGWLMFSAILALGIALIGALSALDCARAVDLIATFAGAFGSGAAITAAVAAYRANRSTGPSV